MLRRAWAAVAASVVLFGCASSIVEFPNATPGRPLTVPARVYQPSGSGPFPAVVLMHGCHGITASTRSWAEFLRDHGYLGVIVDSWRAHGITNGCDPVAPDVPFTERFDDAIGALRYLHARGDVDVRRVGIVGWSNGGVFAITAVNGPSLARARARGVVIPEPGFGAAVALYPGGCKSLITGGRVIKPLLVLIGDADDWTLPGPCRDMVEAMRGRGSDATIVLYPGDYHYFDVAGQAKVFLDDVGNENRPSGAGATVAHDPSADADAHRRILAFFAAHLDAR